MSLIAIGLGAALLAIAGLAAAQPCEPHCFGSAVGSAGPLASVVQALPAVLAVAGTILARTRDG